MVRMATVSAPDDLLPHGGATGVRLCQQRWRKVSSTGAAWDDT